MFAKQVWLFILKKRKSSNSFFVCYLFKFLSCNQKKIILLNAFIQNDFIELPNNFLLIVFKNLQNQL